MNEKETQNSLVVTSERSADKKSFVRSGYNLLISNFVFVVLSALAMTLLSTLMVKNSASFVAYQGIALGVTSIAIINAIKSLRLRSKIKGIMESNSEDEKSHLVEPLSEIKQYAGFSGWYVILAYTTPWLISLAWLTSSLLHAYADHAVSSLSAALAGFVGTLFIGMSLVGNLSLLVGFYGLYAAYKVFSGRKKLHTSQELW